MSFCNKCGKEIPLKRKHCDECLKVPRIKVEKREGVPCYGCQKVRKTTQIATTSSMLKPHGTICLCGSCLGWLKNKLRGF